MQLNHFHTLKPVCPLCRTLGRGDWVLIIGFTIRGHGDRVDQGALQCPNPECLCEFPIIDGIPLLLPHIRQFLADRQSELLMRDDLPFELTAMLHEGAGPGSWLDTLRTHVSSYAWDHYAEFDSPLATDNWQLATPGPGAISRLTHLALKTAAPPSGPILDIGCSVGRSTLELAEQTGQLVLGLDASIPMLRLAQRVARQGNVCYDLRRSGVLYGRRQFPVNFSAAENVDFWAADALCLPFADSQFAFTTAFNILDCVPSPLDLLRSIARLTRPAGRFAITCPYDWSGAVSPPETWIGGHSPRAPFSGDSAQILRAILTPGAHTVSLTNTRILAEEPNFSWHVRIHDRHTAVYQTHLAIAERIA